MTEQQQLTRETMIGPFPLPAVDDQLRADARDRQPGDWIAFVDPAIDPSVPDPPRFAVQGGYKVGPGEQIEDYYINPGYEPSQARSGVAFQNGLELTLWRVKAGYNPLGTLVDAFYHAALLAYAEHPGDARLPVLADPDDPEINLFPVCTSPERTSWAHTTPIIGADILELTGPTEVVLDINPGTSLALRLRAADLARLVTDETPHLISTIRQQQEGDSADE